MESYSDSEIKKMSRPELDHWATRCRKERAKLDQEREAESLRLQAIENKMQTADDPLGAEFEAWIERRSRQLKKIRLLGQNADELKHQENRLEREIYQRCGHE